MAILGGSPLGLIGVQSTATRDGMSTFAGGKSRNTNVNKYNTGKSSPNGNASIFSGVRFFRPFPAQGEAQSGTQNTQNYRISKLHSDSLYDTSVLNILEKLSGTRAALRAQDFAYLKDLGVYPNNRLMIARRFEGAVGSNIFVKVGEKAPAPLATMVTWQPAGGTENWFKITFGEKWTDAETSFESILNDLGDDVSAKLKNVLGGAGLGSALAGGLDILPFPGWTEVLQRQVLEKLGIYNKGSASDDLPAGDPNLIKEAKRRATSGKSTETFSGLKGTFTISMTCEWEQKFISGLDPTVVWLDIISTALRFGTSNSRFYGLGSEATNKIDEYANDPEKLVNDMITFIGNAAGEITKTISGFISDVKGVVGIDDTKQKVVDSMTKKYGYSSEDAAAAYERNKKKQEEDNLAKSNKSFSEQLGKLSSELQNTAIEVLKKGVRKYKHRLGGVARALSGMPSGHWHITIGNPMRPIFTSGDMIIDESGVTLELGPNLAFNDLPSYVKVSFTLSPARNLGLNEIMRRFNSGYLRTVEYKPGVDEDAYRRDLQTNSISLERTDKLEEQYTFGSPKSSVTGESNLPTNNSSSNLSKPEAPATNGSNSYNTGGQSAAADGIQATKDARSNAETTEKKITEKAK